MKATKPSELSIDEPKYAKPLEQIADLAGVRVITFFLRTVEEVGELIRDQFEVVERADLGASLVQEERFGYQSVHYLVRLTKQRTALPEYQRYDGLKAEIQVRTVLQHAWAEIEHDIRYKSPVTTPEEIKRRFTSLAGLLEVADREFQAVEDADASLRANARASVKKGALGQVEITGDSLQAYLDERLGSDARVSEFSYEWTARLLRRLGFSNLEQVEECIRGFDDDKLSRILAGFRQGQVSRFEFMLLAGMGENFLPSHFWAGQQWFIDKIKHDLQKLKDSGIKVRSYNPQP